MKKHTASELAQLFKDGKNCDQKLFTEMRSNILLSSGDHWKKVNEKSHRAIQSSEISDANKIKLTKNHLGAIMEQHKAALMANMPGVMPVPYNETEAQDVKDAELVKAVIEDAEEKQSLDEKKEKWIASFMDIGEMAAILKFDPNAGEFRGYEQEVDSEGYPLFVSPDGVQTILPYDLITKEPFQPVESDRPVFAGQVNINLVWPMNLIRPQGCEVLRDAPWLGIETMTTIEEVKAMIPKDDVQRESKIKALSDCKETTFKVFDSSEGEYLDAKGQVLLKEMYFKPGLCYPKGWFYLMVEETVIAEGELPFGIFPIETEICHEIPTSPRGRSLIKRLRPGQAQINFISSQIAYHQIVLGADKILVQAGSKTQKGQKIDGIREIIVSGPEPKVLQGRSGEQFEVSLNREINDLYKLGLLEYTEQSTASADINVQLYQSAKQRAKYSPYIAKIERFFKRVMTKYVILQQHYLDEYDVVRIAGKREQINVAEFKNLTDVGYQFKLKPITDDPDSITGRRLETMTALQYLGSSLPQEVIGNLLNNLTYMNKEEIVGKLTLKADVFMNDKLAMERGIPRNAKPTDDHGYMLQALSARMSEPGFENLPMMVQQLYQAKYEQHQQFQTQQAQQLKALQDKMIPTSGPLVKVDLYQNTVGADGQVSQKVQKVSLPMAAILDLMQKMQAQGQYVEQTQTLDAPTQISLLQGAFGQNQPSPQQTNQVIQQQAAAMNQPPQQQFTAPNAGGI